jgi:hypothetical protein
MDLFDDLIQCQKEGATNNSTAHDQIEKSCHDELMRYRSEVGLAMFHDTQNGMRSKEFTDPLQ